MSYPDSSNWYINITFIVLPESESHSVVSDSLRPHGLYSLCNSPGQNTGEGSLSLLQWIFLMQESNRGLLQFTNSLPTELLGKTQYWQNKGYILKITE